MRALWALALSLMLAGPAAAIDLAPATWSSLASDRVARSVGDSLTVIVYENETATNTAENSVNRATALNGSFSAGNPAIANNGVSEQANLGLSHTGDNTGSTTRAGTMVAEVSVVVDAVLPNGDLHVTGTQLMNLNGEKTQIAVKGRVRPTDISPANVIVSSSLADATIDYDGQGFVSDSSKPGLLTRALNWIGLP